MNPTIGINHTEAIPEFLAGGGEMGQRIREFDWTSTSLGPIQGWPQSLRTCIRIMLTSRQPIWIGWGKDLIKFYNDPYKAIVGGKHPWALGKPASVVWKEIWKDIEPMLRQVMEKDEGTYAEAQLLIMDRNGYKEETYYTFSYTPIPGDTGGTAGMICANSDDTDRIISERQLRTLTRLGKSLIDSKTEDNVIRQLIATVGEDPQDFPFTMFYSIVDHKAVLSHHTELGEAGLVVPREIDLEGGDEIARLLNEAAATRKLQLFEDVGSRIGEMPKGVWETPPDKAIVLPIMQSGNKAPYGFLVIGLNPHRLLDEKYEGFFMLVADQLTTSFSNVYALEEERKRAEALAAIDKAKTTFFSNISHEFRTPLALLLGPIGDALGDGTIPSGVRENLDIAYRNAIRMQKLVNALLDFSRIEAGRMEGRFSHVDIGALSSELASSFRSAIEKAGMELQIDIEPIRDEVYVDVDMWEKIVLNIVSNAFKYSKRGVIRIGVRQEGAQVLLTVKDNGIGIAADQLERIFDRFHRIEHTEGRSQEGTGIGLAMVKELVKLHHGNIEVVSEPGKGSTFIVSIPTGKEHLPADKLVSQPEAGVSKAPAGFAEEAGKWLSGPEEGADEGLRGSGEGGKRVSGPEEKFNGAERKYSVLVADDNTDMRNYVGRLLAQHFTVYAAVDGEDAFGRIIKNRPDLVLSDIMMPRLDGFGLLKKMRQHPDTKDIPLVFLSARAGEEAKLEGLEAGANDYLVKPFSARELVAVVDANIRISEARRKAVEDLYTFLMQAPFGIVILSGADNYVDLANEPYLPIINRKREEIVGKRLFEVVPEVANQGFIELLDEVRRTGIPYISKEHEAVLGRNGRLETTWLNFVYQPMKKLDGTIDQIMVVVDDVTEQVLARKKIQAIAKEESAVLEEMVRNRTRELNESNQALQQSNGDLQQFAHVASHDLKEPLRKIKIFSGRLEDDTDSHFSERGRGYLQRIMTAVDRMMAMVEGVLDYSSVNASEQPIGKVDLSAVLQHIEGDLELLIGARGAVIRYEGLPVIEGAYVLIYQLLYNIISNSLKFANPGRPLEIGIEHRFIRADGEDAVEVDIQDNGIGFSQEAAERIFMTFARLHSKDKYEGTGLGLSLCKRIVERHGGRISARGELGKGAVFTIVLPLRQTKTIL